jgi:putative nucleotidyltransferase with HDIG domain
MTIPSRLDAAALLLSFRPVEGILEHSMVAADVASFLAEALLRGGHRVDRSIVEAAALLHDIDKALAMTDPLRALGHGHAGARWLEEHGYAELAPAVDAHPVGRLTEQPYADWVAATSIEQRLVAYADKRSQDRLVTLDERFERWRRKHRGMSRILDLGRERAAELEAEVCGLAGIGPGEVQRLRWAEDAIRDARSLGSVRLDLGARETRSAQAADGSAAATDGFAEATDGFAEATDGCEATEASAAGTRAAS